MIKFIDVPEGDIECESFTVISVDFFLVYENNYYFQTIVLIKLQGNKWQIILMKIFFKIRYYKCCIKKELI